MVHYTPASELKLSLFKTPFDKVLDSNNRWVILADLIPWDRLAAVLKQRMSHMGRGSIDLRHILGALLIKGLENLSDEDTIQLIRENVYMQYFVGLRSFQTEALFSPELFVSIRKRLGEEGIKKINDELLKYAQQTGTMKHRKQYEHQTDDDNEEDPKQNDSSEQTADRSDVPTEEDPPINRGVLKLDATVAPQHIHYPTDTRLLNECRLAAEGLIDHFHQQGLWGKNKPRTYRRIAKGKYLDFAKKRRPSRKAIKQCIKQQLQFIRRDINYIDTLIEERIDQGKGCPKMSPKQYRDLLVIHEIYRQQQVMYKDSRRRIDDRIVNLHQPWVRPIIRGKAGTPVEFGAKLNVSETDGFIRMDRIDYNNFHEAGDLEEQIEAFKSLYGHYPASVLVDKIYLNTDNRNYLKANKIAHYGPPLGRPPSMSAEEKRKRKKKQNKRSEIEGKFGTAKFKFGMNRILTRRIDTSMCQIGLITVAMNICRLARDVLFAFLSSIRLIIMLRDKRIKLNDRLQSNYFNLSDQMIA